MSQEQLFVSAAKAAIKLACPAGRVASAIIPADFTATWKYGYSLDGTFYPEGSYDEIKVITHTVEADVDNPKQVHEGIMKLAKDLANELDRFDEDELVYADAPTFFHQRDAYQLKMVAWCRVLSLPRKEALA
jgi:hypothetical protein